MYVLTIDQRGSTTDVDRVPGLIAALRSLTPAPFERSVGDELQGVVEHAADVVDIALHALRDGHWYVGIGIGAVQLAPGASPREGTGSGFVAARKAVETGQGRGGPGAIVSGVRQYGAWPGHLSRRRGRSHEQCKCPGGAPPDGTRGAAAHASAVARGGPAARTPGRRGPSRQPEARGPRAGDNGTIGEPCRAPVRMAGRIGGQAGGGHAPGVRPRPGPGACRLLAPRSTPAQEAPTEGNR